MRGAAAAAAVLAMPCRSRRGRPNGRCATGTGIAPAPEASEQDAAPVLHHVLDDRAGHAHVAGRRAVAAPRALGDRLELLGALVLDQDADRLGLREQLEQRAAQRVEQLGRVVRCAAISRIEVSALSLRSSRRCSRC